MNPELIVDNSAGDHSAYFYIMNTDRTDGEINIDGKWYISNSVICHLQ